MMINWIHMGLVEYVICSTGQLTGIIGDNPQVGFVDIREINAETIDYLCDKEVFFCMDYLDINDVYDLKDSIQNVKHEFSDFILYVCNKVIMYGL